LEYLVVSFTHKNSDISTREKLSFNNDLEKEVFLKGLLDYSLINEAILLSTCNRIELILSVNDSNKARKYSIEQLSLHSNISKDELFEKADIYENDNAIYHIFAVASSLDSLVIGETQIAGQLKDAFKFSLDKGCCGQKLSRVISFASKCSAKVRTATHLGIGSVSVASVAVMQAKSIFKDSLNTKALVIGAGQMSELAARHLLKNGFDVILCSRNIKKARVLAHSIISDGNGENYDPSRIDVQPYENLQQLLNSTQLLITATSAPYPIITATMVKSFHKTRHWFDIALPRDIDDIKLDNLHIYYVDDLQCIVDENLTLRANKAKEAFNIVKNMTIEFYKWLNSLSVEPMIKQLYLKADDIIEKRVQIANKKKLIKKQDKENITKLCKTILNEFLHTPTTRLREASKDVDADSLLSNIQDIFNIKL
jgi:glutamyl-tRNA reductase